jgi:hypothetical protein
MKVFKAGAAYCSLVFGAGFVLGALRVSLLVPRFGERISELSEMPMMFAVILIAARFVTRRFAVPLSIPARLGTGLRRQPRPRLRKRLFGDAGAFCAHACPSRANRWSPEP